MKKFSKILALAMAAAMFVLCLTGCGSSGKTVESIQKAGQLVIATSPDFPPFEELGSDGEVTGIEIDILNMICDELGVELKIEQMSFDSVIPGIVAGKYDVGVSGISVTPEREKNVLFTTPYCLAAQAIVVTADSPIKSKADLEGKTVAVQTGTTAEVFCMEQNFKVMSFEANSDAELALLTGKVDAWVIDDLTAADMVSVYNEDNGQVLVILDEAMTTEPYAFAFSKDDEELVKGINEILSKLIADGTIAATFEKFNAPYTAP